MIQDNLGIIELPTHELLRWLDFCNAELLQVEQPIEKPSVVRLLIRHKDLPLVIQGGAIPIHNPTYNDYTGAKIGTRIVEHLC